MKAVIFPIVGGICIASAWLVLIFKELQSLLTHVIAANPFAPENGKSLGRIAVYLGVFAFIKPAFVVYIYSQMIHTFSLGGFHTTYKIDILLVFISLMLALLGQVFKYGSYLQTEFDETL